jgi:hypothetical protein
MGKVTPVINYKSVVSLLQQRPGTWAKIGSYSYIPNVPLTLRSHGCEVVTQDNLAEDGTFEIWARWDTTSTQSVVRVRSGGKQTNIQWQDPPSRRKVGRKGILNYDHVTETSWVKPQTWFNAGTVPVRQRIPVTIALRKRGCEVVTRKTSKEQVAIWVQWPSTEIPRTPTKTFKNVEWENPPAAHVGLPSTLNYENILSLLQSKPGTWAKVAELSNEKAEGPQTTLRRRGCDVAVRRNASVTEIWAVWPITTKAAPIKNAKVKTSDVPNFTWGSPPKIRTGRTSKHNYDEFVERMREKTGQWVTLGEFPKKEGVAAYHALRRRGCAVKTTSTTDGKVQLAGRLTT